MKRRFWIWLVVVFAFGQGLMGMVGSTFSAVALINPDFSLNAMEESRREMENLRSTSLDPRMAQHMEKMLLDIDKSVEKYRALSESTGFKIYSIFMLVVCTVVFGAFFVGGVRLFKLKYSGATLLIKAFVANFILLIVSMIMTNAMQIMPDPIPSFPGMEALQTVIMVITTAIFASFTLIPLTVLLMADKSMLTLET